MQCADENLCLAVGKDRASILDYFDFSSLEYATAATRLNMEVGGNGLIHLIDYVRGKHRACAILKSSVKARADNLLYEYLVGLYVNKLASKYLCFIETYGIYRYNSNKDYLRNIKRRTPLRLSDYVTPMARVDFAAACEHPTDTCIMIQCLKNTKSVYDRMKSPTFVRNHLLSVLYQVYFPLAAVAETFTHYDLHLDNILVVELADPVQIRYGVTFKTRTLAKVIDYGRCYFHDSTGTVLNSSPKIRKSICESCKSCGRDVGFSWLEDDGNEFHVLSTQNNRSHDLYALRKLKDQFAAVIMEHNPALHALLETLNYENPTGTVEYMADDGRINCVHDASKAFERLMQVDRSSSRSSSVKPRVSRKSSSRKSSSRKSSSRKKSDTRFKSSLFN